MFDRYGLKCWPAYFALGLICGGVTANQDDPLAKAMPFGYPMGITWLDYTSNADIWRNSTAPEFTGIQMGKTRFDILVGSPYTHALGADHTLGVASILATRVSDSPLRLDEPSARQPSSSAPKYAAQGYGFRLGWMGQLSSQLSAGMSVQSKIYANGSEPHPALLEEAFGFETPPKIAAGLAYSFSPKFPLGFDWQRIYYSTLEPTAVDGAAGGTERPADELASPNELVDLDVFQIGLRWHYTPRLTLRAAVNHQASIFEERSSATSTAVAQTHANLGLRYRPNPDQIFTLSYTHVLQGDYDEQHPYLLGPQTGPHLRQNEIELTWGLSFD